MQYFQPLLSYHFVIKIFVLSIFEWPFKTGYAVLPKVPVHMAMGKMRVLSKNRLFKIIPLLFEDAISSAHPLHFRDNVQVKPVLKSNYDKPHGSKGSK